MYKILCFVTFITVWAGISGQRFYSTRGKDIIDPQGMPVILKGINLGNWLVPEGNMFQFTKATSPRLINDLISELGGPEFARYFWSQYLANYISSKDIIFIKSLGLNTIRVPVHYKLFTDEDYMGYERGIGFSILDSLLNWCRREKLYVILDMHCAPCGQTGQNIDDSYGYPWLFEDENCMMKTSRIWREIARRYRNDPTVVGYDLLNDPIPQFYDTARLNSLLEPAYRTIVSSIREVDNNHIIFLGGSQWNTNFKIFGPPFDQKLVYTFHRYWCDTTISAIQEYIHFRDKYNVPVWMGESGENTDDWIKSFRSLLEENNIGWCFWTYKKMNSPSCIVTFSVPDHYNEILAYEKEPNAGFEKMFLKLPPVEHVRTALLNLTELSNFKNCKPNTGFIQALGVNKVY
jgi:aryl-phospho-beta-D-glucosidase BglC (GH1 family)